MMFLRRLRPRISSPRPSRRFSPLRAIVFDFGDTLMRDFPPSAAPTARRPRTLPGVRAALAHLPPHLTCCAATSATDSNADLLAAALARVRIRHHFRHLLTRHELHAPKTDPAFYHALARLLDLPPAQILMVGHSLESDILPAHAAGLRTLWITRAKPATLPPEADAVIASMRHLTRTLS